MPKEIDMSRPIKQAHPVEDAFTRGWKEVFHCQEPASWVFSRIALRSEVGDRARFLQGRVLTLTKAPGLATEEWESLTNGGGGRP